MKVFFSFLFLFSISIFTFSQNVAPVLTATGNQTYCPQTQLPIVTNMSIIDPDDTGIDAIYIQISQGYVAGQDILTLTGAHTNISSVWNAIEGKLTLTGINSQPTYIQLIAAIEDVVFSNSNPNPSGQRTFSITVGQANYLASTGHYYQYIPNIGITWQNAKIAAQNTTYYGLQGYLATITSMDEVQISGIQASGAGWIGGTDEETEGIWKWATGPEAGTVFWNGLANGSSPNFAFWNTGEPNNFNNVNEDYAHVTAPGVGILGSWNDLTNTGENSGNYQPKGYIVEYGGMPNDPVLQISTTSTITIPEITNIENNARCGSGSITISATASTGTVHWYANPTDTTPIFSGSSFTTPVLNVTTNYYVDAFPLGCISNNRIMITATVNQIPTVTITNPNPICTNNSITLQANIDFGTLNWFTSSTGGTPFATGTSYTTPILDQTTTYYLEGTNFGCVTPNRIPIIVIVNPVPVVTDENLIMCENTSLILNAGISNATYLWSTGATTQNINISEPGNYPVIITNSSNCSATKNFTVIEKPIPVIESVIVNLNSVTIVMANSGDFEYSIDGINYFDSNVFEISQGGFYTAHVRQENFCGFDDKPFVFVSYPTLFSPNGDGTNDYWKVTGIEFYPQAKTYIFDRFGKLITTLHRGNPVWDGNLNGQKLPASDYWFSYEIPEINQFLKGHFSLIR